MGVGIFSLSVCTKMNVLGLFLSSGCFQMNGFQCIALSVCMQIEDVNIDVHLGCAALDLWGHKVGIVVSEKGAENPARIK